MILPENEMTLTAKLNPVRQQLRSIRRRRQMRRVLTAATGFLTPVLWILLCLFAADLLFNMDSWQRLVALGISVAGACWSFNRHSWPWLSIQEDQIQVALQVEREHEIDSDLVAALQFDSPLSGNGGSLSLRGQVVQRITSEPRSGDWGGSTWDPLLRRRSGTLLVTGFAVLSLSACFPDYAKAFTARLVFLPVGYPTATKVERLAINGESLLFAATTLPATGDASIVENTPVEFSVVATGRLPATGRIELKSIATGRQRSVALSLLSLNDRIERLEQADVLLDGVQAGDTPDLSFDSMLHEVLPLLDPDAIVVATSLRNSEGHDKLGAIRDGLRDAIESLMGGNPQTGVYHGRLDRLTETASYRLTLGDARNSAGTLQLISLPIVELTGQIDAPRYVHREPEPVTDGITQLSVLAGSTLHLNVSARNKPLEAVWLTVHDGESGGKRVELQAADSSLHRWNFAEVPRLFREIGTPFRFELQVTDTDGLHLLQPIWGEILLQADQPPTGSLSSLHTTVLPTAKPDIHFKIEDDFAISRATLRVEVTAADEGTAASSVHAFKLPLPARQLTALPYEGQFRLDVSTLGTVVGDTVRVRLEVVDYRGGRPGEPFHSEQLTWKVRDESTVLDSIAELDEQTEQRLTEIIQQQLKVRNSP